MVPKSEVKVELRRHFMCIECVSMEEFLHSALSPSPPPSPKSEVSRIYASLEAVIQASEKTWAPPPPKALQWESAVSHRAALRAP